MIPSGELDKEYLLSTRWGGGGGTSFLIKVMYLIIYFLNPLEKVPKFLECDTDLLSVLRVTKAIMQWNLAIRPPRYYDQFVVSQMKAQSFPYFTTSLIIPSHYYHQQPLFGFPSRYFLYNLTSLIRPVKRIE